MDRLTMLNKAQQLAYEQIDGCSSLSDERYSELVVDSHEKAIKTLAMEFLKEAAEYNLGE